MVKRGFIIVLCVIFLAGFVLAENNNTNVCTDSDSGKNYYKKGFVFVGDEIKETDECSTNIEGTAPENITEYYCKNNSIMDTIYECPYGCDDGACLEKTKGNKTCIEKDEECCLGSTCNSVSATCLEGSFPVFTGCDEECNAQVDCVEQNETESEKICCEIYGLGSMMKKVYIHYQWMKKEDCVIPEAFVGGGREIVKDSLCANVSKNENKKAIQERNRIRFEQKTGQECADDCICTGVVMKCSLEGGGREMTVYAGKSGNIIVQVKGVNMSTNVTLYHYNNSIYGIFKGNETKEIKVMPDEAKERIRERVRARIEKYGNITLNEDGYYEMQLQKRTRLFFLFPVREHVRAEVEAETGDVKVRNPWWGFLARDVKG